MVRTVKFRKMGGSIGATLPKDLAERLHLDVGNEVFLVATDEGLLITPCDPTFAKAMETRRDSSLSARTRFADRLHPDRFSTGVLDALLA